MTTTSRRRIFIAAAVIAIPVLAVAWWLGSPLFLDREVNETFPETAATSIPGQPGENDEGGSTPTTPDASELASGLFQGADDFHEGAGRATIYDLGDSGLVLRLEAFMVTNGPDLHVYLVPDADPLASGDVSGYLDLGELKGNVGDQNYEIPQGTDVAAFHSVVIYCEPFAVIFATAALG